MYHEESDQEGFLVLHGECLVIVEGEERHGASVRRDTDSAREAYAERRGPRTGERSPWPLDAP